MSKGLFITGTGTDIGKTYVTALLVKTLRQHGYDVGYYKAAISGARPSPTVTPVSSIKRPTSEKIRSFSYPTSTAMPYRLT